MKKDVVCIILMFVGLLGLTDVVDYDYRQYESWCIYLFAVLLSLWKALALVCLWKMANVLTSKALRNFLKACIWLVAVVYTLLCLLNYGSSEMYGFGITRRLVTVLMQTNMQETAEYMPSLWSRMDLSSLKILILIVVSGTAVAISKARKLVLAGIAAVTVVLGAWIMSSRPNGRANYFVMLRTAMAVHDVRKSQEKAQQMYAEKRSLQYKETVGTSYLIDNMVLVIGESVDVRHSSLYGYKLPTNQYTQKFKDSLLVFTDVISPFCGTNEVMTRLLTFMDDAPQTKAEAWASHPDIVSVMKAAGFSCYWISNQQKLGNYMDCTTPIASNAQQEVWLTEYSSDNLIEQYDAELLPHLRKALKDGNKKRFIVLHTMGAHPDFKCRYPRKQTKFTANDYAWNNMIKGDKNAREVSAEYDNAVAYGDSVVAVAAKVAMQSKGKTLLLYVSDHGQNVYDSETGFGHHENHVNVPMLVFYNKAYSASNKSQLETLETNLQKPITTANLIHSLLGLAGVRYKLYNERLDISSGNYAQGVRYANEKAYKK